MITSMEMKGKSPVQARLLTRHLFALATGMLAALALAGTARADASRYQPVSAAQIPQVSSPGKEISRTRYQQYVYTTCKNQSEINICVLDFDKIPVSSRLDVSNVSCHIQSQIAPGILQLLVMSAQNKILSASTMVPTRVHSYIDDSKWLYFASNHAVSVFANATQHFQIYMVVGIPGSIDVFHDIQFLGCHVSGDLVKLGT
jgi:hypothetical protein